MKNWKRVTLVSFVLIGSTASFGYWSFKEFDLAINDLGKNVGAADISIASQVISSESVDLATSTNTSATSTETEVYEEEPTSMSEEAPSESLTIKPFNEKEFRFVFPSRKNKIYIGCTYTVSWVSSTTIQSLGTSLVDAGTLKSSGPIASGLSKENTIDPDIQNIKWKVGKVWPGKYYIYVSTANGTSTDITSQAFMINEIPVRVGISEQEQLCETSGGVF